MKKKQATKKLSLNKQTIANLNKEHMNNIVGGNDGGNQSAGFMDTNPCDTNQSAMIPELCEHNPPLPDKNKPTSNACPTK